MSDIHREVLLAVNSLAVACFNAGTEHEDFISCKEAEACIENVIKAVVKDGCDEGAARSLANYV